MCVCVEEHNSDATTDQNTPASSKREPWWWGGPVTAATSFLLMTSWEQTESLTFPTNRSLGGDPGVTDSKSGLNCIHFRENTLLRLEGGENQCHLLSGPLNTLQRPYSALCEQLHQRQPSSMKGQHECSGKQYGSEWEYLCANKICGPQSVIP